MDMSLGDLCSCRGWRCEVGRTSRIRRRRAEDVADSTGSLRAVACIRFVRPWCHVWRGYTVLRCCFLLGEKTLKQTQNRTSTPAILARESCQFTLNNGSDVGPYEPPAAKNSWSLHELEALPVNCAGDGGFQYADTGGVNEAVNRSTDTGG
jgi:hypothetical protein